MCCQPSTHLTSQYYFNPEGVRFRSRAEAVRHYDLVPVAAPKGASKSQPTKGGGRGGGPHKGPRGPKAPKPPKREPYVPIPDKIPRAEAVARARATETKTCPFTVAEGVVVTCLGRVDARPKFHDPTHVYPVGYATRWTNPEDSATFFSEVVDAGGGERVTDAPVFRVTRVMHDDTDGGAPEILPEGGAPKHLVCEGNTPLAAWCEMVVQSSRPGGSAAPGDVDADDGRRSSFGNSQGALSPSADRSASRDRRPVANAGSAERFCLDELDVVKCLEADRWVDDMCPAYQFCEQRGTWAEEGVRRAKSALGSAQELLRAMRAAAKASKEAKAAARRRAAEAAAANRKPALTREEKEALEVRRVMDRLIAKVEGVASGVAKHEQRARERQEAESRRLHEKAKREMEREQLRAAREADREREKMEKEMARERERATREAARERDRAEKEATREREKEEREAAREAAKAQREAARELERAAKALEREAAREEREKRKAEEAAAAREERAREANASRWLHGMSPREPDDAGGDAGEFRGPAAPPPSLKRQGLGSLADDPSLAGDVLEVWAFLDRFREVLYQPEPSPKEDSDDEDDGLRRPGRRARGGKKSTPPDARAPYEAAPPTPAALAAALLSGDAPRGAALVATLLSPLLASSAQTCGSTLLADALSLFPVVDPSVTVPGGLWEESLRRYLLGAAASMDLPPEGATVRAAAEAAETVCRWACGGGPTVMVSTPDTGSVVTPSAAAALAASLEGLPRPCPALAARADAEALAMCEVELYAQGGESSRGEGERRARALSAIAAARTDPRTHAVRQAARVLAHSEKHRHPAVSRATLRAHGNAANQVPFFAAVAAGAGAAAAARAKHPRVTDLEAIDARAAAGVYAVADLIDHGNTTASHSGGSLHDTMVAADAAECGEMLARAGAPSKDTATAVPARMERAARRGKPEARGKDGVVAIDGLGTLALFGEEPAGLPKVAWDDGCSVCGGDIAAGPVLLCDACDGEYHCACLSPPLASVPDDDWYCPACELSRAPRVGGAHASASTRLVALAGTQLEAAARGAPAGGTGGDGGGSTRERAETARRLRRHAERLANGRGWAGLTPAERLATLRELTWQLLDAAPLRAALEAAEKRGAEYRDGARRHVKDWPSYRKHGMSVAERDAIAATARAAAEERAEAEEAEAKLTRTAEEKETAGDGAPRDKTDNESDDADDADDEREPGKPAKSYAVRMAGIAAAASAVATIGEAEGRVRWQARWHELEAQRRAADLRLEPLGVDRHGAAYWLLAPWGQLAVQPAGYGPGGVEDRPSEDAAQTLPRRHSGGGDDDLDGPIEDAHRGSGSSGDASAPPAAKDAAGESVAAAPPTEAAWGMYSGLEDVSKLTESLNPRGFREGTLWRALERRYGAPPQVRPPPPAAASAAAPADPTATEMMETDGPEDERGLSSGPTLPPLDALVPVPPAPTMGGDEWRAATSAGPPMTTPTAAVAAARSELLALDAALSEHGPDATCPVRFSQSRRAAWRRMVTAAEDPAPLAMASCLLEAAVRIDWLAPAWLPWSAPAPALRAALSEDRVLAAAAVLMRAHALRRAVVWGGAGGGGRSDGASQRRRHHGEVINAAEPRDVRMGRRAAAVAAARLLEGADRSDEEDDEEDDEPVRKRGRR